MNRRILGRGEADFDARIKAHEFAGPFLRRHPPLPDQSPDCPKPFKLWVYWAQGFDGAPPVVGSCLRRLAEMNPEAQIVTLDDRNLANYTDIPGYVYDRIFHNKTHFSDILRCALLAAHGGIWADATCYCAQPLRPLFDRTGERFFAYSRSDIYLLSSWFMIAPAGAFIPTMMRDILYDYWSASERLEHYFWIHYLFEALYDLDRNMRKRWDRRVRESSADAHTLQGCLTLPFDQNRMEEILALTPIQKLTYKIPDPPAGSYWHVLCKGGDN